MVPVFHRGRAPMRVCLEPTCPTLTNRRRCPQHASRGRRKIRSSGYDAHWRRQRARFLRSHAPRDGNGELLCYLCGSTIPADQSPEVDHILARAKGGSDDVSNLGAAHKSCHSRKTVKLDGGWGNEKRKREAARGLESGT
jgi:5-methylcytosine-specific restriction protein A